jgi:prepilin-type N-terminal cleavage/methylation domain-containing protein
MNRVSSQAGFSLTELMIAVAIIGIMAAIGIPSFKGIMPRIRLNTNVMVLSNEIALARVRAISKSTDLRIVFDTVDESYTISKFQAGAWQSLGVSNLSGSDLTSASGFNVAQTLIAMGNGQVNVPLNSQAVIEVRTPDGANRKQIVVEPTGRMFVQKWDGSAWVQE